MEYIHTHTHTHTLFSVNILLVLAFPLQSSRERYVKDAFQWMVPFLHRCESQRAGAAAALLREYLVTMARDDLTLPLAIFQHSKPDVSTRTHTHTHTHTPRHTVRVDPHAKGETLVITPRHAYANAFFSPNSPQILTAVFYGRVLTKSL